MDVPELIWQPSGGIQIHASIITSIYHILHTIFYQFATKDCLISSGYFSMLNENITIFLDVLDNWYSIFCPLGQNLVSLQSILNLSSPSFTNLNCKKYRHNVIIEKNCRMRWRSLIWKLQSAANYLRKY